VSVKLHSPWVHLSNDACATSEPTGAEEFISILLSSSSFITPLHGSPSPNDLTVHDIESFLLDMVQRFAPDNELEDVLGPVVRGLLFHGCLFRPEGIAATDSQWRGVVGGLEALVTHKSIAHMITCMEEWVPMDAGAADFETKSLMGPLLRLNVFQREWVGVSFCLCYGS